MCNSSWIRWGGHVSSVTVTDSSWNGRSFLQGYVLLEFLSDVRIKVTCIEVNFIGEVVILLGQCVKKFFNLTFARSPIHASNVNWVRYQGRAECP